MRRAWGLRAGQAARLEMKLPEDVLKFVANSFRDHARELHGALLKLHATSRALGRDVTLALAERALADSVTRARQPVRLADVRQAICEVFGIDPENLCSAPRTGAVAHPRMLAMWLRGSTRGPHWPRSASSSASAAIPRSSRPTKKLANG